MQYFGGKSKICRELSHYINSKLQDGQTYWEPFCGSCWVITHINPNHKRIASDIHPDLIEMWKALQLGWIPPTTVSEHEYQMLKKAETSALRGFIGFGCSNSGKWFGGYARNKTGRNYAKNAHNSLCKKIKKLKDVKFLCCDYASNTSMESSLIYCDPPYRGTTGFANGKFDHDKFWNWVRERSLNNTVLVSEYFAPDDFECVWQTSTKTDMKVAGVKENRIEKLFVFRG